RDRPVRVAHHADLLATRRLPPRGVALEAESRAVRVDRRELHGRSGPRQRRRQETAVRRHLEGSRPGLLPGPRIRNVLEQRAELPVPNQLPGPARGGWRRARAGAAGADARVAAGRAGPLAIDADASDPRRGDAAGPIRRDRSWARRRRAGSRLAQRAEGEGPG